MQDRAGGQSPHVPPVDLQVLRVKKSQRHQVRTLAGPGPATKGRILGYLTHWDGYNSRVCLELATCPPALHKIKPVWYGYLPVERWDEQLRLWVPMVLQVTESMELDMRGRVQRGQFWTLAMAAAKKKGNAARAELDGACSADELPHPFDILPVLRGFLRERELPPPWVPSPCPDRVALAPSAGAPPPGSAAAAQPENLRFPVPSEGVKPTFAEVRKRLAEGRPSGNGKH